MLVTCLRRIARVNLPVLAAAVLGGPPLAAQIVAVGGPPLAARTAASPPSDRVPVTGTSPVVTRPATAARGSMEPWRFDPDIPILPSASEGGGWSGWLTGSVVGALGGALVGTAVWNAGKEADDDAVLNPYLTGGGAVAGALLGVTIAVAFG